MLVAGVGGFVGTCARYAVGRWCSMICIDMAWAGTLAVNLIGCLLIGILWGLVDRSRIVSPAVSALLITGFCGGFTTFSTFANDIWQMANKGAWCTSALYMAASIFGGLALLCLGRALFN